eukprot:1157615-Pelagomonas_calceolata.AAC.6
MSRSSSGPFPAFDGPATVHHYMNAADHAYASLRERLQVCASARARKGVCIRHQGHLRNGNGGEGSCRMSAGLEAFRWGIVIKQNDVLSNASKASLAPFVIAGAGIKGQ